MKCDIVDGTPSIHLKVCTIQKEQYGPEILEQFTDFMQQSRMFRGNFIFYLLSLSVRDF